MDIYCADIYNTKFTRGLIHYTFLQGKSNDVTGVDKILERQYYPSRVRQDLYSRKT